MHGVGDEQDPGQVAEDLLDGLSSGVNAGISYDLASTVTWARTMPVLVSSADSRCTWRPSGRRAPRKVSPSTAITVR
jgi:hypothetical protein